MLWSSASSSRFRTDSVFLPDKYKSKAKEAENAKWNYRRKTNKNNLWWEKPNEFFRLWKKKQGDNEIKENKSMKEETGEIDANNN